MKIKCFVLVRCTVIQPLGRKETSYAHAKDLHLASPSKPDLGEKESDAAQGCGLHEKAT